MTQFANVVSFTQEFAAPKVGDGATLILWTDRLAYTILAVSKSGKTFTMQQDNARRTDALGRTDSGQQYEFTPNTEGGTRKVRMTKRGWRSAGQKVIVGVRDEYHDYSF